MTDPVVLKFLADRGKRAKYVTSVCSGSLVLGAAGLLQGYKASCHWALHDAIALFGATSEQGRVVIDRNRVTGGGVTAGIDFALVLLAKLLGEDIAKMTRVRPRPTLRRWHTEQGRRKNHQDGTGLDWAVERNVRNDVRGCIQGYG